ncbi:MAG: hypothetical protein ABSG32_08580 [Terriglobia bacterium]|jgi:hypothetical protein
MKDFLSKPISVEWPVEQTNEPTTKKNLVYFLLGSVRTYHHALNEWTADVDHEVSAIYDHFHEGGVRTAVRQSRSLEEQLRATFESPLKLNQLCEAVERLETKLDQLLKKLDEVGSRTESIMVPIETLAPEPYQLLRSFTAVITKSGEDFEACLFDASIFASGDTEEDAVANLKDTLIDAYERLNELGDDQLGPGPLRQKKILNKLMCKVENR